MSDYDVIVIGSGIGGLSAALVAAKGGQRVLVLEAKKQFGGFINPFARKKFWFDTGIHYVGELGEGQGLYRNFDKMGLFPDLSFHQLNPKGFDRYVFPDYEVRLGNSIDAFHEQLASDFPHEKANLQRFFKVFKEIDNTLQALTSFRGFSSALKLLPRVPQLLKYKGYTYGKFLNRFFTDIRLKAALAGPGGDIGLPPGKASALMMIGVISHFAKGAYYPEGGTKKVRDTFVDHLKKHGAELKRNSPVEKILLHRGKVCGVRTAKGEEFRANTIISNASVLHTLKNMVGYENIPTRKAKKIENSKYSLGSICVFVGTSQNPANYGLDDANVWHYTSYDIDSLYQPVIDGHLGKELPFFLTVPTLKDPGGGHAPTGKHTVELISFAPWQVFEKWKDQPVLKRDQEYKKLKEELGHRLLAQAESYIPNLRSEAEVIEISSPLTNTSYVNTPQGSFYGLDHTPDQIGPGRWTTKAPIGGLLFCGADVFGAGISPCVASGVAAGKTALSMNRSKSFSYQKAEAISS